METIKAIINFASGIIIGIFSYRSGKRDKELEEIKKDIDENKKIKKKMKDVEDRKINISEVYDENSW